MSHSEFQSLIAMLAGTCDRRSRPRPLVREVKRLKKANDIVGRRLFPDEYVYLRTIAEEIDHEKDGSAAWELVEDIRRCKSLGRPDNLDVAFPALATHVQAMTVPLIVNAGPSADNLGTVGSGTLISIGDRTFIATASHHIPKDADKAVSFINATEQRLESAKLICYGRMPGDSPDVAFVEIDPDFVINSLGKSPVGLERVYPIGPGQPNQLAFLAGFPRDLIEFHTVRHVLEGNLTLQFYLHTPIAPEDWDMLRHYYRDVTTNASVDFFLTYPVGDEMVDSSDLPLPHGISGGGFWQRMRGSSDLWSPTAYGLVAVQSSFCRKARYVRGVQIGEWLKLLWRERLELRKVLEENFGETMFLDSPE
ncbi:MAG: hypothetical protein WDZ59_02015 [Pirellulales bacterium]